MPADPSLLALHDGAIRRLDLGEERPNCNRLAFGHGDRFRNGGRAALLVRDRELHAERAWFAVLVRRDGARGGLPIAEVPSEVGDRAIGITGFRTVELNLQGRFPGVRREDERSRRRLLAPIPEPEEERGRDQNGYHEAADEYVVLPHDLFLPNEA